MFSYLNHFGFDRLNINFKEERNFIRFYHNFSYFVLDLPCVTEHSSFHAVCLNRDVLWTALVSLHDRESAGLPDRQQVSNRYSLTLHIYYLTIA